MLVEAGTRRDYQQRLLEFLQQVYQRSVSLNHFEKAGLAAETLTDASRHIMLRTQEREGEDSVGESSIGGHGDVVGVKATNPLSPF